MFEPDQDYVRGVAQDFGDVENGRGSLGTSKI